MGVYSPLDRLGRQSDQSQASSGSLSFKDEIYSSSAAETEQRKTEKTSILLPGVLISLPMLLLAAALLAVVFGRAVKPGASMFGDSIALEEYARSSYILVDFSATQITFLASFISTVGPLLAGSIMSLAAVIMFQHLKQPHASYAETALPTPYQMSLLIGIAAASYEQLWRSLCYLASRKRTTKAPALLWYTAATLLLCIFLGIAVIIADAVFHTVTESIEFTLYPPDGSPQLQSYGRGLNEWCYNFDRLNYNDGFPCSYPADTNFYDPNLYTEQAEAQHLYLNSSTKLQIRHASVTTLGDADITFLMPNPATIANDIDYRATTFGASAQCKLIPSSECNVTRWNAPSVHIENFNCSNNFWGALGLPPNGTDISVIRQPSAYVPLLSVKSQLNLQYGFFSDYKLQNIYNPAGLNDSGLTDPNLRPLSDLELSNKIYAAFAWRSSMNSFLSGWNNEMAKSDLTSNWPDRNYVDFFLRCELATYDVDYVWFDQSLSSISATQSINGTLLNMWQGATSYGLGINGVGYAFQVMNSQAAVAGNKTFDYETKFGSLLSEQILSRIGGYTSPRHVIQQQRSEVRLLTKVPKAALATLVVCSLLYPVLGLFLLFKAYKYSREHDHMAPLFSYWGLASTAWNENAHNRRSALITAQAVEACEREEKIRLCVERDPSGDFCFALWKNGSSIRADNVGLAV